MSRNVAKIEGEKLIAQWERPFAAAHVNKNYKGEYRWYGMMRSGKKHYSTAEEALRAAAKQLGFQVV